MTNNSSGKIVLEGVLNINLDGNPIIIECEGQELKLIFTSYYGIRKFMACLKILQRNFASFNQDHFDRFRLSYYFNDVLIGESNKDLPFSRLGEYIGLCNTKFYFKNLIKSILRQ